MPQRKKKKVRKAHPDAFKKIGLDKPPETKVVKLSEVYVDGHYQRVPRMHKIDRWVSDFNPIMCLPLVLNKRTSGKLYVMDGNHRLLVLQRVGHTEWRAYITEGLDSRQEAEIYKRLNTDRSNANCIERFRARLWYKDPIACTIQDVCRAAGFKIVLNKVNHRSGREIHAVESLDWIFARSNQPGLRQTLELIAECWTEDENRCTDSVCIKGIHVVLNRKEWKDRLDLDHLTKRLKDVAPSKLIRTAKGFTDRGVIGEVVTLFSDAVVVENNRRLRKHSKFWLPPRGMTSEPI